ncbi:hypothetical protein [Streptomyces sp. Act143]|uniref:hypothetical protein n=1 Tax=Streptomyces sp. Act143 TaxID=2200760 RepID=UPI0015E811CA|nr:hypothetical protein [Streptomyces sp. Act143]
MGRWLGVEIDTDPVRRLRDATATDVLSSPPAYPSAGGLADLKDLHTTGLDLVGGAL